MGKEMYQVKIGEETRLYEAGTTYREIVKEYQKDYEDDIVLVFVNGKLQELFKKLKSDCVLEFETTAGEIGHRAYQRSISLMMVKAVYDVAGHDAIEKVRIHFSVSKGYYCTVKGDISVDQAFLSRVEARMREMVEMDMPINKRSVRTDDAIALFGRHGMHDKERLFRYRRVSKVNIYSMNEFEDYHYGYMVPSAGYLKYFKLYLYDEGFVVQMPVKSAPKVVPAFEPQNKLFHVLKESVHWGDIQGIETVGALNDRITRDGVHDVVLVQEALQEKKIAITFDDGPHPVYTEKLLDGLKDRDIKATFFVLGEKAKEHPEIIERMQEEGHIIGNHTYTHIQLRSTNREKFRDELIRTNQVISGITEQEVQYVRPPYGTWDKKLEEELNMFPVLWNVDPNDWCTGNTNRVTKSIVDKAKENSIILLHDCYQSSVDAALSSIDILEERGFRFVTVEEILFE